MAIVGSDKTDFKARSIRRDKKESNKKTKNGQSQEHIAKSVYHRIASKNHSKRL